MTTSPEDRNESIDPVDVVEGVDSAIQRVPGTWGGCLTAVAELWIVSGIGAIVFFFYRWIATGDSDEELRRVALFGLCGVVLAIILWRLGKGMIRRYVARLGEAATHAKDILGK